MDSVTIISRTNGKFSVYYGGAEWRTKTGRLRTFDSPEKAERVFLKFLDKVRRNNLDAPVYDPDGTATDMIWN